MALDGGYYRIAGNVCGCKIFKECCTRFRRNFCGIYFHISLDAAIGHTLMYHDLVFQLSPGMAFLHQEQRPSYARRCGRLSPSPQQKPFSSICSVYLPRRVDCSSCSVANRRRQRSTQAWKNVYSLDVTTEGHLQVEKVTHSNFIFTLTSKPPKICTTRKFPIIW